MRCAVYTLLVLLLIDMWSTERAFAWNARGHRLVAYIAYQNLDLAARARVDALLRQHHAYDRWTHGIPESQRGLVAFLAASIWPDDIKSPSSGFANNECESGSETETFGDRKQNRFWHYKDVGFSTDGTPVEFFSSCPVNAETKIIEFQLMVGDSDAPEEVRSFALSWLIHLVGDVHQPLHVTTRFSASNPRGDVGGNRYGIETIQLEEDGESIDNLHWLWDNILGERDALEGIRSFGDDVRRRFRRSGGERTDQIGIWRWMTESTALGRYFIHSIDLDRQRSGRPEVSEGYLRYARYVATERVAVAGYRLAALLNARL